MSILERIFEHKRQALVEKLARDPRGEVRARAQDAPPTRGFLLAIEASQRPVALVAEVKKASPVKGVVREDFDPVAIARTYEEVGATCLSVLTDEPFFQGSPQYLKDCRAATSLPVLRKDFTVDAYDIYEARAMGADCVLLIVNGLTPTQLREYRELAEELGMDALVEAHSLEEAELALSIGAKLVGLNNRDLTTFETTIDVSERILPQLAGRATLVSESALHTLDDVNRVAKAGARAVLIGTAFCKADDISARVREVMGW